MSVLTSPRQQPLSLKPTAQRESGSRIRFAQRRGISTTSADRGAGRSARFHNFVQGSGFAPSLVICALSALLSVSACVPKSHYEEAVSAAELERESLRRSQGRVQELEQQLAKLDKDNAQLKQELSRRGENLSQKDERLAEANFDTQVLSKEREAAKELVTQLRGELARVGDHLRAFSEEKQRLEVALAEAEERVQKLQALEAKARQIVAIARDSSLLMPQLIRSGDLELTVKNGAPVYALPMKAIVLPGRNSLTGSGKKLVSSMVQLSKLYPELRFGLQNPDAAATQSLSVFGQSLIQAGIRSERIVIEKLGAPATDTTEGEASAPNSEKPAASKNAEAMLVVSLKLSNGATPTKAPKPAAPKPTAAL